MPTAAECCQWVSTVKAMVKSGLSSGDIADALGIESGGLHQRFFRLAGVRLGRWAWDTCGIRLQHRHSHQEHALDRAFQALLNKHRKEDSTRRFFCCACGADVVPDSIQCPKCFAGSRCFELTAPAPAAML